MHGWAKKLNTKDNSSGTLGHRLRCRTPYGPLLEGVSGCMLQCTRSTTLILIINMYVFLQSYCLYLCCFSLQEKFKIKKCCL